MPHVPQFIGSVLVLRQRPLQMLVGELHPHVPPRHCSLPEQTLPHDPQFVESVVVFTHVPLQL